MENKKRDFTFYLTPETSEKIDAHRILEGKVSRSEFVETAINFYCGVMDANENRAFLGDEIIKAMRVIVKDAEGRIFSHFRSQDISLSMLAVLFAANLADMPKEDIELMREEAIRYVDENFRAKSFVVAQREQRELAAEDYDG
ncbi:MAG: ribbon-helix-helix protein, CopG family [Clostridia bacterium]|nr:ribbon-helix-helix protein, CopG family [Clostridia bacterium]